MPPPQSPRASPSALAIRSPQAAIREPAPSASSAEQPALATAQPPPFKPALTFASTEQQRSTQHDWRAEAHASVWRGRGTADSASTWFSLRRRPYVTAAQRKSIIAGTRGFIGLDPTELANPIAFHVDFSADEIRYLQHLTRRTLRLPKTPRKDPKKDLYKVLRKNPTFIPSVLDAFEREALPGRVREDVDNLIRDLLDQKTTSAPAILSVRRDGHDQRGGLIRSSRVHSLLLAREISGQRGMGSMRRLENFTNEFRKCREDDLEKRAEWTGCAGDIFTITWVSNDGFICGTTEHSDAHNQQYNKPGNLVLGSCSELTLRAYPEHRIVRPIVEKGENSTEAMRQSQDPWLYSSVVSSDYDAAHDRAYTSSFDRTVKIWKADPSGAAMTLLGEWRHDGNVNLVVASKHESGMVATAADVAADAVRVYDIDPTDISGSRFRSYSCSRVTDERGKEVSTEKWAYYPATMQWGLAPKVRHLLLVGYSPRSRTGDDNDIPEDRRDSGELCLWDGITGERWRVTSATTQNVFEVLWHPTQESFIAATSPLGLDLEPSVRTQIRVFRPADRDQFGVKAFSPIMTLDCPAVDVNELTIMPNSFSFCYVTAGCTDGNTYVWDTALSDKPIHVLRHGEPIDEYRGDREREDVGVKFTAWGTTPDRFYTGSSDGVVKVWNIRSLKKPLVRHLLEAPAPVTAGMFSPDKSRLVVGDASGRVFMLSIDEEKEQPTSIMKVPIQGSTGFRIIQRPVAIIPHPDPPPPTHDAEGRPIVSELGSAIGRAYLDNLQLERHPNPTIGVVQGPRYAETNLFRRDMHFNEDPRQPLLARWEAMQQEAWKPPRPFLARRRDHHGIALRPPKEVAGLGELHARNKSLDIFVDEMTRLRLEEEGVDWELGDDYLFKEEE
ncbi:WD40 repeat-like protein [Thermothelomyces heterothallicus CBS 203.75]